MLAKTTPSFLLASPDPAILATLQPVLEAMAVPVEVVLSSEAALAAMTGPDVPGLVLLDVTLPGMEINQLLASANSGENRKSFPIVLISDTFAPEWSDRLAEGLIDDLVPRTAESAYWKIRIDAVLRNCRGARELELLRQATALNAQTDRLTGVYNREAILSMLFRETDRIQRMKGSLCMILFDIDDFGHWNSRLGGDTCDELLCQVVSRTMRLLRSYDLLGRVGKDEFLVALPGCSSVNAMMLAERLRLDVFSSPFRAGGECIRLSACFGLAGSNGRSPLVVLREAEQALLLAKKTGPETIQCFDRSPDRVAPPVTFLLPTSGDQLLAW